MPRQRRDASGATRVGREPKSVRVGRSRTGKGVFARRHYKPYEPIGEIVGELFHDPNYGSDYCFFIGDDTVLEPQSPFRFVNHSCDPNCEFDWIDVLDTGEATRRRRVFLFAVGDIRPGDELTIDYNWSAGGAIPCRCGSATCRGWIVNAEELDKLTKGRGGAHENRNARTTG